MVHMIKSTAEWQEAKKKKAVIVDFTATWYVITRVWRQRKAVLVVKGS